MTLYEISIILYIIGFVAFILLATFIPDVKNEVLDFVDKIADDSPIFKLYASTLVVFLSPLYAYSYGAGSLISYIKSKRK